MRSEIANIELIDEFAKSKSEVVQVWLKEMDGSKFLDVRVWAAKGNGEKHPTNRGVFISVDHIDPLMGVLSKAMTSLKTDNPLC